MQQAPKERFLEQNGRALTTIQAMLHPDTFHQPSFCRSLFCKHLRILLSEAQATLDVSKRPFLASMARGGPSRPARFDTRSGLIQKGRQPTNAFCGDFGGRPCDCPLRGAKIAVTPRNPSEKHLLWSASFTLGGATQIRRKQMPRRYLVSNCHFATPSDG